MGADHVINHRQPLAEQVKALGTEWGIHQSKELIKHGVPSLHFYSFMASNCVRDIAKVIF